MNKKKHLFAVRITLKNNGWNGNLVVIVKLEISNRDERYVLYGCGVFINVLR